MNKLFLSEAIRENPLWRKQKITAGEETVRATVIGVGNCSMEVSGSTIYAKNVVYPVKNLCSAGTKFFSFALYDKYRFQVYYTKCIVNNLR